MKNIRDVLSERGARYGEFKHHAELSQIIQNVFKLTQKWEGLAHDQKEALIMIAHKIARILNGDPDWEDSWRDIAGYSTLVADRLLTDQLTGKVEHKNGC